MSTDRLHVVVGATGGVGRALVRALVMRGERVRAVSRSAAAGLPAAAEFMPGDATDAGRMRAVVAGASVVYNCVNPPFTQWRTLFPRINTTLIGAAASAGATLVFADDTWMYGPPADLLNEEHPSRPAGEKGAELADSLLDAHRRGDVRAVIGRASELYGPHVESLLGANLFRAALTVTELVERTGLAQNLVSYHLSVLRQAGLVQVHRSDVDARASYYGVSLAGLAALYAQLGADLAIPSTIDLSALSPAAQVR